MKHRNGSVYIFVLGSCTLAAAAGITAVTLHRQRLERVRLSVQAQAARADAQSALEFATAVIGQDPAGTTWRSSSTLAFADKRYFGPGASDISIALTDPGDNDLTDSNLDPIIITVAAANGPCEQAYEMTLTPGLTPLSCLNFAVVVAGTLTKSGTADVYTSGTVSTGKAWEVDSDTKPDALATFQTAQVAPADTGAPVMVWRMAGGGTTTTLTTTTSGTSGLTLTETGSDSKASGQRTGVTFDAATMEAMIPNATDSFKHYASIGTTIAYSSLGGELRNTVLSPNRNPYGATNAQGVYVIDCGGGAITIRDCRVHGTLVILNAGSGSVIRDGVCIEPTSEALPALMVQGSVQFDMVSTDIAESSLAVNLNPATAPYAGVSDSDTSDVYPSWIKGLTYVSGSMTVNSGSTTIRGMLAVRGNLTLAANTQLRVRYAKPSQPVPGFARITGMSLTPGSLKRVVN
ncbi:MAG TPA: hypothetical protein VHN77_09910 [Phycisphaerales bacterium]|nr:hypothetical protein [Phycisphaerales bacterium]